MFTQKKLVNLFKDFFDKACLSYIREHASVFKEWLYFSSMLSQQSIDYQKVSKYVKELGFDQKNILTEKPSNIHSLSVSYSKNGATTGNFYKIENDVYGKMGAKSPTSNSMDYAKHFSIGAYKSDKTIIKQLEGINSNRWDVQQDKQKTRQTFRSIEKSIGIQNQKLKHISIENQKEKQKQREKQIQRERQIQKQKEKQKSYFQPIQRYKQKESKKPLSKLVANLSNLYESFSDNQRIIQKRLNPFSIPNDYFNKQV